MKKHFNSVNACLFITALVFSNLTASSQSGTFSTIQGIMQANCSASGCHGGGNANVFDVTVTKDNFYTAIINVPAVNAAAAEKGNKIVDPGHPYNSFLLRKIGSNNFDPYIKMNDAEKNGHPSPLQNHEIELIRQWITFGAPKDGTPVDYNVIQQYYANPQSHLPFIPVPEAPAADKGMQLRMGPLFLKPGEEFEYMKKEKLHNTGLLKVGQTNGYMSWQSHHMLLFKYADDGSGSREGVRKVPFEAAPFNGNIRLTGAWQNDGDFELPAGTAFYWAPNTILDFDYHIKNYSQTEILPTDFYLNILYSDEPEPIEMMAELVNNAALIFFSQGVQTRTTSHVPGGNENRYIYMISSHTHKFGTNYNIFLRNPDGSKGEQIYDGLYNSDYTFVQGFYNWDHPPVRYFQNLKPFNASHGLIYETEWNVTSCTSTFPCLGCVCFGLTTDDEMMLFTYLYTKEDIATSVFDMTENPFAFTVVPNPVQSSTRISFNLNSNSTVSIDVFDVLGKKVNTLTQSTFAAGNYSEEFSASQIGDNAGVYFITLNVDGRAIATQKVTRF